MVIKMKEVKISIELIERLLTKGNKINISVEKGLDYTDKIVSIDFKPKEGVLVLWCDTNKITQQEIVCKSLEDLK